MITSPLQISNCQVWLDASDTTTLFQLSGGTTAVAANNDPVGYWGDKSPNNRHFTNIGGSASTRPTWIAALSTVRFDGVDDNLTLFSTINFDQQTVFVVAALNSFALTTRIYSQVDTIGGSDGGNNFNPIATSNTVAGVLGSTSDSAWANSSYTIPQLSAFNVITHSRNAATYRNFLNGIGAASFTSARSTYTAAVSRLAAGLSTNSANSRCNISEVIVYDKALTNAEREDVEYYLARKWNSYSIPRQVYAIQNGNWSSSTTWSTSADPVPWNFPLSSDNVYSNTFTVTADSSTRVDTIRNSANLPNIAAGGTFVTANNVSLSATIFSGPVTAPTIFVPPGSNVSFSGTIRGAFSTLAGSINGGSQSNYILPRAGSITLSAVDSTITFLSGTQLLCAATSNNFYVDNAHFRNCNIVFDQCFLSNKPIPYEATQSAYIFTVRAINCNVSMLSCTINGGNTQWTVGASPVVVLSGCNVSTSGPLTLTTSQTDTTYGSNTSLVLYNSSLTANNIILSPGQTREFAGLNQGWEQHWLLQLNSTSIAYLTATRIPFNSSQNTRPLGATITNGGTVFLNVLEDINSASVPITNSGTMFINARNLNANTYGNVSNSGTLNIITGDINCNNAGASISNSGTMTLTANRVIASNIGHGITSSSNNLSASRCSLINAPNGRQAIYAPSLQLFPGASATYTRHAVNGYDSYVDYWTSNATFTYPASSDVVLNTTYRNNTLTGSMVLPSPSSVYLNCPVGSTTTTIFQITTGNSYLITSNPFNTNFGLVGASSNIPGTIFTATSAITPSTPLTAYNSDLGRVVPLGTSLPPTVDSFWNRALSDLTLSSTTAGGKLKNVVTTQQLSSIYTGLLYTAPGNF